MSSTTATHLFVARFLVEHKRQRERLGQAMQTQRQIHRRSRRAGPATAANCPVTPALAAHGTGNATPGAAGSAPPSEKRVANSRSIATLFFNLLGEPRA